MSPTPPSTSSSTGVHSPEGQYRVVRRRNRVPLSCAPCRSRKLKCNRAVPCENCIKRGDAQSCTYAERKNRRKNAPNQNSPTTPDDMQNRIDRLEGLVLSLMTNGSQSGGAAAAAAAISATGSSGSGQISREDIGDEEMDGNEDESDTEQVTKSFGILKMDNQKSYYISDAHWSAVLSDIAEVKQYFTTHKKQYEEQAEKIEAGIKDQNATAPSLIFGAIKKPNESEIMSTFPSKYTTDILMARYFNTYDPSTHILHGPTFWKEYAHHWEDPSQTSIVWIGMIFAMMRLAMLSYHRDGDEPPEYRGKSLDMAATYRNSMSQCLVLADYTKPHRYLMETLILHLHGDFSQSTDAEVSVWILIGLITRLAMRMGYHREPKLFPNITPFQSEMRRRMWTFIRQADILFSFQVGLPCMIRGVDTDTGLPRNIHDEDFDENSTELPPERPPNEPTPISYLISKARLAFAFGRVLEYTQHVKGSSYDQIMQIDSELREAQELIPERLRTRPIAEIKNEPAAFITARFSVASIYYKAQCVLHRRFLTRGRENARYVHSRRSCIDSALELLKFQSMLHAETRPNGVLQHRKWYMSSLSTHDFLMAGTIIALDLHQGLQYSNAGGQTLTDTYVWGVDRRLEMLNALRRSRDIWSELKDKRMEAWKATVVMDLLLEHVSRPMTKDMPAPAPTFDSQDEKQNAAMTLGLLSSGLSPGVPTSPPQFPDLMSKFDSSLQQGMMDQSTGASPPPFGMFNQMPDMQSFNLDWDAWDNYLQTATVDPTNPAWPSFDFNQIQPPNPIGVPSSTTGGAETYVPPQPFFDGGAGTSGSAAPPMYMDAPNNSGGNLPHDRKRG